MNRKSKRRRPREEWLADAPPAQARRSAVSRALNLLDSLSPADEREVEALRKKNYEHRAAEWEGEQR